MQRAHHLRQFIEREAKNAGLTIKGQKSIETDNKGQHFHRAKFQFSVSGAEDALYRWFYAINIPDQFRIATDIRLSPVKEDDTKIECVAIIEQWFVPLIAAE